MPNNFVTPVLVADKMLEYFDNILRAASLCNRTYEKDFRGGKGSVMTIKKPPKFTAQDGPAITTTQSINQGEMDVTIAYWKTVPINLSGVDLSMNYAAFENWSQNFIQPAASVLCNHIDAAVLALADQVANHVGTPGTSPASYDAMAAVAEMMTWNDTPETDRYMAMSPHSWRTLGTGLTSLYNPQSQLGNLVMEGKLPDVAGIIPFQAQNVLRHTNGALGGTPKVNGASQLGAAIITDGWTASTTVLEKGDVITLGVYMVNPVTKATLSTLQPFVVTAQCTADGSGNLTIPIYPSIITSGAYQTVNASPADNATVTLASGTASYTYTQNLAFHRNALGLVMVPIRPPSGLQATTRTYKNMAVTITHGPDIMNFQEVWRADVLFGTALYYPELACRLTD